MSQPVLKAAVGVCQATVMVRSDLLGCCCCFLAKTCPHVSSFTAPFMGAGEYQAELGRHLLVAFFHQKTVLVFLVTHLAVQ